MPLSSQPSAVRVRVADRRGHGRAAEVAVAEELGLRPFSEPRRDLQRVAGGQQCSQPEEPQPAESSVTTREKVGRSHS